MSNKPQIENIFELTNMQEGMLYYSLLESNSNAYYETFKFVLNGDLDIEIFEKSFNKLIERHSSFRTLFKYNNVLKPLQVILKKRNLKCYFENLSGLSNEEQEDKIEVYNKEVGMKRYNLEKDLLIRVAIFKLKEKEFKVCINFHHIIMDGWCIRIVMGELFEIYKSIIENIPLRLKDVPNSKLYYEWIRKQDKSEALQYWDNYLLDYRPSGNTIKLNNPLGSYNQEIYKLKISKDILDKVNRISVKYSATINTFFSAIWAILMEKYTSSNDIVFGSVVSGRPPEIDGIEDMVGVFINTIPVRARVDNNSFIDILKKCQKDKNDSMSYEYSSISEIYSRTELKQNIIDHIIVFENYPVDEGIKSMKNCSDLGLSISEVQTDEQSNYDLNIVITPSETLNIEFKYNKFAYSSDLIQSLAISIQLIFEQIVANENITIGELDIVDNLQKQKLLNTFNDANKSYDNTKTLEKYFEEQVEKNPEKTAV
ncbi:MAG: condensation domain-containing protein, partial [Clostridium sp.]